MAKMEIKTWDKFNQFSHASQHSVIRLPEANVRESWISHLPEAEQAELFATLETRSYVSFTDRHGRYNQLSKAPEMSASLKAAIAEDRAYGWQEDASADIEAGLPYGWR